MMKRARQTRTTIEMREVIVIRGSPKRQSVLCPECSAATVFVTVEEAVRLTGISARAIYRLIEAGKVHFAETADGLTLICPATLFALVCQAQGQRS
jgi:hypothetical protein